MQKVNTKKGGQRAHPNSKKGDKETTDIHSFLCIVCSGTTRTQEVNAVDGGQSISEQ